ncbi:MAG TPA: cobyric acid synthase, partial [Candidatus Methanoperedenaceae archaeon]|nr:cobyric acid synthase [Candidatus Methanoperedenaceae archaeon]
VGDIERGGVFASIYGTLELLPDDIKPLVKGIIINKFRGDIALLEPGLHQLEKLTGIPVLGVLPYMKLGLPSEDSLSLRDKSPVDSPVEIAVMRLPHISNFTDFEPLEPFASVRYVELSEEPGAPDAVIIPGTKNTIDDMRALERSGKAEWLRSIAGKIPIIGICGGYQMLGKFIHDSGIEGSVGACSVRGLGLLDATTHFGEYQKSTRRVRKEINRHGPFGDAGDTVEGYEIHMGETVSASLPLFGGEGSAGELVFGSYMHGLFENDKVRDSFLSYLYERRGRRYEPRKTGDAFDELAAAVRDNIDMAKLYNIAGL